MTPTQHPRRPRSGRCAAAALLLCAALPAQALPESTASADIALWFGGPSYNRSVSGRSNMLFPLQPGAGSLGVNGASAKVGFVGPGGGSGPRLGLVPGQPGSVYVELGVQATLTQFGKRNLTQSGNPGVDVLAPMWRDIASASAQYRDQLTFSDASLPAGAPLTVSLSYYLSSDRCGGVPVACIVPPPSGFDPNAAPFARPLAVVEIASSVTLPGGVDRESSLRTDSQAMLGVGVGQIGLGGNALTHSFTVANGATHDYALSLIGSVVYDGLAYLSPGMSASVGGVQTYFDLDYLDTLHIGAIEATDALGVPLRSFGITNSLGWTLAATPATPVPEPAAILLWLLGTLGLLARRWWARVQVAATVDVGTRAGSGWIVQRAGPARAACRSNEPVQRGSSAVLVSMALLCAVPHAGATVWPRLPILATVRASCGLSSPGVTGYEKSGEFADCNLYKVSGEAYGEPYTFFGDATGRAQLLGNTMRMSARVTGLMTFDGEGLVAQGMVASAGGFMSFDVVETSPAPFVADVPVHIEILASASVQGNAGAALQVKLDDAVLLNRSFSGLLEPGSVSLSLTSTPLISLGSGVHRISKAASCVIVADSLSSRKVECEAMVDPILSLDQAAFDAAWGDESFSLKDHYAIRVSANLAPIPEPASGALLLAGFGLLGCASRLRARTPVAFSKANGTPVSGGHRRHPLDPTPSVDDPSASRADRTVAA